MRKWHRVSRGGDIVRLCAAVATKGVIMGDPDEDLPWDNATLRAMPIRAYDGAGGFHTHIPGWPVLPNQYKPLK